MLLQYARARNILYGLAVAAISAVVYFFLSLRPVASESTVMPIVIRIEPGESVAGIARTLHREGVIRSSTAFTAMLVLTGSAKNLKAGVYDVSPALSAWRIRSLLIHGPEEVSVTIPEGSSLFEVDALLAKQFVIREGELSSNEKAIQLEGWLFPDTYRFYRSSSVSVVLQKMLDTFRHKTDVLLKGLPEREVIRILTLASLLEDEVPDYEESRVVASILEKRLKTGMPLQVDATICYIKRSQGGRSCYPLTPLDFKIDLPYNTYLYKGMPPGPINSPGLFAIQAALNPKPSSYWYYLSDPATKKTHFSETLEEHARKRALYLHDE
jgi:UPF0755 protein